MNYFQKHPNFVNILLSLGQIAAVLLLAYTVIHLNKALKVTNKNASEINGNVLWLMTHSSATPAPSPSITPKSKK